MLINQITENESFEAMFFCADTVTEVINILKNARVHIIKYLLFVDFKKMINKRNNRFSRIAHDLVLHIYNIIPELNLGRLISHDVMNTLRPDFAPSKRRGKI